MDKAVWVTDYDWRTDKCYEAPGCPIEQEPLYNGLTTANTSKCPWCEEPHLLDDDMVKWFQAREGTKVEENQECFRCGQPKMRERYHKNWLIADWEIVGGECTACGCRYIV